MVVLRLELLLQELHLRFGGPAGGGDLLRPGRGVKPEQEGKVAIRHRPAFEAEPFGFLERQRRHLS